MKESEIGIQWHNVSKGKFPADKEEIIISVNGVYYFSIYDLDSNVFRLRENPEKYFNVGNDDICWIDFMTLTNEEI